MRTAASYPRHNQGMHATFDTLQSQLDRFRQGQLALRDFISQVRPAADPVLPGLPSAFATVWHNLLDRLESSALFAEESCSFSQTDLIDSLQMWIDKARVKHVSSA